MSHLPGEHLSVLVSFFDSGLEHEVIFLQSFEFALQNKAVTFFRAELLMREFQFELHFLELLDDFLLGIGSSCVLCM